MNGTPGRLRPYEVPDRDAVVALWARCDLLRPWNDPHRDIDRKLARDAENLLVYEHDDCVSMGKRMEPDVRPPSWFPHTLARDT